MRSNNCLYVGDWSFSVRKDFILNPNISIGAKGVYLAILSHASPVNATAFPSSNFLAKALNISRDTVFKYVNELKIIGLITVVQKMEKGKFSHSEFTVYATNSPCAEFPHTEKTVAGNSDTKKYQSEEELPSKKRMLAKFQSPTIEEVKAKASELGLPEREAEKFHSYYESNGWRVGKNPMKKWAAAMVTWRSKWQDSGGRIPVAKPAAKPATVYPFDPDDKWNVPPPPDM